MGLIYEMDSTVCASFSNYHRIDFAVISMLLFFFGDLVIENLLLGWAGILIVRFALWLRTTGLRTIEYFIEKLPRLMRLHV